MKRRTFTINSKEVIKNLASFLETLPLEPVVEVIVQEKKKDRTVAQNRLYRLWGNLIADELGWERNYTYRFFRKFFLIHIYERDHQGHAEALKAIREVYILGAKVPAKKMHDYIVERISTADATLKQFTEYLKQIERFSAENGIVLPYPEDRYYSAMGIKQ
jgi:hypothetical protein